MEARPVRAITVALALAAMTAGCQTGRPQSFVPATEGEPWPATTIALQEGLSEDRAWNAVANTIALNWGIESHDRNAGWIRSGWTHIAGDHSPTQPYNYSLRMGVEMPPGERLVRVKSDAYYGVAGAEPVYGMDRSFHGDVHRRIQSKLALSPLGSSEQPVTTRTRTAFSGRSGGKFR